MRTFEVGIQWEKGLGVPQTVGQRAGASGLPSARQKDRRGYLPLWDGGGKKDSKQRLVTEIHTEETEKMRKRLRPPFSGERAEAFRRLLARELGRQGCPARDKRIIKFIEIIPEIQILSYFPQEEMTFWYRIFGS